MIDVPENLPIDETDFCSVIGNIMENALTAVSKMSPEDRHIELAVSFQYGNELYIAQTNKAAYDSQKLSHKVKLTIGDKGSGIGLKSIKATAERYNGYANFYIKDEEFHSDVLLKARA